MAQAGRQKAEVEERLVNLRFLAENGLGYERSTDIKTPANSGGDGQPASEIRSSFNAAYRTEQF